jgi:predicted membrane-bound spermidine synthase
MGKSRSFLSIAVPSGTVFLSSFCIMVLELVAARLIARHLGSSLYTWTAVIGVVLAGITIGNYLGGRIADKFAARKALAILFALASVACVVTVIANNLVGGWVWLWRFSWPMRVFSHVSLVFLLPSVLLGTISPVVAKMALEQGLPTGRTVGDIYAWGAAGSIAGTFATGYYLIAAMGTTAIIWTVGGVLLLLAICYWARLWVLYVWAAIFIALLALGLVPAGWAKDVGADMALREKADPDVIYEDESQYCYVAVKRISENPDRRAFMQDKLKHSDIVMGDILDLQYSYERIHAATTQMLSRGKDKLSVLVIGGGGYVFPRYVEHVWPGSRVDVVEIDPGVTEAAMQAFGLERDSTINTFTMDARNYVNQLLEQGRAGGQVVQYDFIFEDALNDYSVPYQLTTK